MEVIVNCHSVHLAPETLVMLQPSQAWHNCSPSLPKRSLIYTGLVQMCVRWAACVGSCIRPGLTARVPTRCWTRSTGRSWSGRQWWPRWWSLPACSRSPSPSTNSSDNAGKAQSWREKIPKARAKFQTNEPLQGSAALYSQSVSEKFHF